MDLKYDNWTIVKKLGGGSFGSVYEIEREDFGVYKAALKVISIPQMPEEVEDIRSSGMSDQSISNYFSSMVQEIVNEFALMAKLKGTTNIVSYEDHRVIPHEDGIGYDIYIRMELLTPLDKYIKDHPMDTNEVARLGINICRALERCQKLNIIHRDIKPSNIFVSEQGDYKLGDFGIARTAEQTVSNMSRKGTTNYMAPEVYNGNEYGRTVDIYSLGLVMYRLLNHNRMPFLPPFPDPISFQDQELAHFKRISGKPFPHPDNASGPLGDVVLKACAFDPKDRFQMAGDFREALEKVIGNSDNMSAASVPVMQNAPKSAAEEVPDMEAESTADDFFEKTVIMVQEPTTSGTTPAGSLESKAQNASSEMASGFEPSKTPADDTDKTATAFNGAVSDNKKSRKSFLPLIIAAIAVVVIAAVLLVLFLPKGKKDPEPVETVAANTPPIEDNNNPTKPENDGPVTIPAFKNLSKKEVVSSLETLGLSVNVAKDYKYEKDIKAGNVVELVSSDSKNEPQTLKEGDQLEKNASVTVYLCGVPVPKGIVGSTEEDAQKKLSDLGFKVNTTYDSTTGTYGEVIDLMNAKGTKSLDGGAVLKKGTTLTLVVSQYAPQQQEPAYTEPVYTPEVTPATEADPGYFVIIE